MGLDMFLYGIKYYSNWRNKEKMNEIGNVVGFENKNSCTVKVMEVYWRKSNAIHRWFVENIQDGEDDCRNYEISTEKLIELRDLCKQICKNKNDIEADELLPTQEGFFFGGTEYDEWYYEDLERTYKELTILLKEDKYDWYEYGSSW